jgi:Excreted virulence factor EspC, type VII ESX diderm
VTSSEPAPPDLTVAPEALESEAARWSAAAADLRAASDVAAGLVLEPAAFSFAGRAAAAAYETLRSRTAALLAEGAGNLDAIAASLRSSAAAYVEGDTAGARRLDGLGGGR